MILQSFLTHPAEVITNCDAGSSCQTHLPNIAASSANLQVILQILFGVIAVMTVIFIIISAIRYQVSLGNPDATAKLRNTIIFAVVGLAVALSAEAIVSFVLWRV